MRRRACILLLVLLSAWAAAAEKAKVKVEAAADETPAEDDEEEAPALVLYCNQTGACKPCGASGKLNEHCRSSGGYARATCLVVKDGSDVPHEFKRPLKDHAGDHPEGSTLSRYHGCAPTSRVGVPQFLAACALGAGASLLVVRLRARQLRRMGF